MPILRKLKFLVRKLMIYLRRRELAGLLWSRRRGTDFENLNYFLFLPAWFDKGLCFY